MQAAKDIHEHVVDGEITGLAVVVHLRGRRFFVDVFGTLEEDPVLARGMVAGLDDDLRELVEAQKDT